MSAPAAPAVPSPTKPGAWGRRLFGPAPVALLLAALVPPPVQGGASLLGLPTICGFRALVGVPCPACGMTRALVCCCHLRFGEAFGQNPVGPLLFGVLVFASVMRWAGWEQRLPPRTYEKAAAVLIGLLLLLWPARLAGWLPVPP
jgi:hypothetical protein